MIPNAHLCMETRIKSEAERGVSPLLPTVSRHYRQNSVIIRNCLYLKINITRIHFNEGLNLSIRGDLLKCVLPKLYVNKYV